MNGEQYTTRKSNQETGVLEETGRDYNVVFFRNMIISKLE